MSVQSSDDARAKDPANRLWSRFARRRMTVEEIRDSFLQLGGELDLTQGGSLLANKGGRRGAVNPDDVRRRTIYLPVRRGSIPTMLSTFDFGDATTPGEGRSRTNVAPQASFMMNSDFIVERSWSFARRVGVTATSNRDRLEEAYLAALARRPAPPEVDDALSYLDSMERRLGSRDSAWQSFCRVLMASNEFLYLE